MAITRTPIIDDSGSGQDGTVIDNAWKQQFYDQIDSALVSAGASERLNGTATNYVTLGSAYRCHVIRHYTDQLIGFIKPSAQLGDEVIVLNAYTGPIALLHESATAAAGDRLANLVTSGSTMLATGRGAARYVRD